MMVRVIRREFHVPQYPDPNEFVPDDGPLRLVWEALARGGYGPHGHLHDFLARCPGHADDKDTLAVGPGADGRVLLDCFGSGCDPERIAQALGLAPEQLFPAGHRKGSQPRLKKVVREELTGNVRAVADMLAALERGGLWWSFQAQADCPYCGGVAWLRTSALSNELYLDCSGGCSLSEFSGAVARRANDEDYGVAGLGLGG